MADFSTRGTRLSSSSTKFFKMAMRLYQQTALVSILQENIDCTLLSSTIACRLRCRMLVLASATTPHLRRNETNGRSAIELERDKLELARAAAT
ncbi:hypothetical protein EON65_45215 [archaeon]|nr:MAG: hypothetical protein EON65_45215 [archaeon]